MLDPKPTASRLFTWFSLAFTVSALIIIALAVLGVVSFQLGLLMLVGLVAVFVGLSVLVLVYRFVAKLE